MPTDDRTALPSWWRVTATFAVGAVIALVLALAVTVMDEGRDPRPVASIGAVYDPPFAEDDPAHPAEVVLPWQRIDVAVGTPQDELPDGFGEKADVAPPAGGSFVRVDARLVEDGLVAFAAVGRPLQTEVELVLRADGAEYPLSGPSGLRFDPDEPQLGTTGSRWVAVRGTPSDLEVAVVVDGQEQTVRPDGTVDSGRAQALADLPRVTSTPLQDPVECGSMRRADDSPLRLPDYVDDVPCKVTLSLRTPYVDGLGWAPSGREYLTVIASHGPLVSVEHADGERWDSTSTFSGTLDGKEPTAGPLDVNDLNAGTLALQDPDNPQLLVFEVPEGGATGDLTLELTVDAWPDDPFDSGREQMRLEWTVPEEDLR